MESAFESPTMPYDNPIGPSMIVRTRHAGFSLVELMVALAIASLLLGALAVMFVNTSIARGEIDRTSRQVESGRYAMSVLADDVRHAGFYGPLNNAPVLPGSVTTLPDPCSSTTATVQNALAIPLQGYTDGSGLSCLNSAAGYKANTAVVVIRRADTTVAATTPTTGYFNIQVSGCPGDPARYVLNTDTSGVFTLHSNGAPGCTPITSAPAAKITPYYQRIYYVSTCSQTDCSASGADNIPTLKRIDITPSGAATPKPIVDGIENLQFDYGIDTSGPGDGSPDVYTDATTPLPTFAQWPNVMAVRIHVLARNLDNSSGFTDTKTYVLGPVSVTPGGSFRRHAYNQLVRLNNPAGRRE